MTELQAYREALEWWACIYRCFPKTLSTQELQDLSVQFCAHYIRCYAPLEVWLRRAAGWEWADSAQAQHHRQRISADTVLRKVNVGGHRTVKMIPAACSITAH